MLVEGIFMNLMVAKKTDDTSLNRKRHSVTVMFL